MRLSSQRGNIMNVGKQEESQGSFVPIGFDRKRKGKTLSNKDWESPVDPDARIKW